MRRSLLAGAFLCAVIFVPSAALLAQELQIVSDSPVVVHDPATSRAYYGTLQGSAVSFTISQTSAFPLFLTILAPFSPDAKQDISATVIDVKNPGAPVAVVDGPSVEWQKFTDSSAHDDYLAGPSFRATLPPGDYEIRVTSTHNDSPYVLLVGEGKPNFVARILNAYSVLPAVKKQFFNESLLAAYAAPILFWPAFFFIVALLFIALAIAYVRQKRSRAGSENF